MSGFEHIVQKLRGCRGQHRMRDPATLYKCEICPSLSAPAIRVHPRRFVGAASAAGAVDARLDPLSVMVERSGLSKLVAESRVVLAEISLEREAASVAAAQSVLAGTLGIALDLVLYLKTQFNTRNKTRGFNMGFIPQVSNQVYNPGIIR